MKNKEPKLLAAGVIVMLVLTTIGIATAPTSTVTPMSPTPDSTPAINASDVIQTVTEYFNGNVTRQEAMNKVSIIMPIPTQTPPIKIIENTARLEISPQYSNLRLQVGESKSITVRVKNKDDKTIIVRPIITIPSYDVYTTGTGTLPSYGEYTTRTATMEKDWVKVTPESIEIPAGSSQRFTVNISIPKDASVGYYNGQIAFTDNEISTLYPQVIPNYVYYFSFSIDVWDQPKIYIMQSYISSQLEAGREYDFEVNLKNTRNETVDLNPIVVSDNYYGSYTTSPALTDDAITITSPQSIPANAIDVLRIHIKVPVESKGYYNGWIDLGVDDPALREGEGRINLNFNIWTMTTELFIKSFNLVESAEVTIEVTGSSYSGYYPYPVLTSDQDVDTAKEPSFEVYLEGIAGDMRLNTTKKVLKGVVGTSSIEVGMPSISKGIYQESSTQYVEIYNVNISAGEWKLKILPKNVQDFQYAITIE